MNNNPFPIQQICSLNLSFDKQGSAYSNNYNDIYFQPGIGLEEKVHVFLKGNDLPNNWQNKNTFCIGETGFGTGLNFLNTLKLWDKSSRNNQNLHYISCELHPLNKQQLQQALAQFPELEDYSKSLIDEYPQLLLYGFHRVHFKNYGVTLTLIFGDCVDAFEQLEASIDAWYLDGFGPSKNPEMWDDRLFKALANLSHIGTTAATFTVARKIRDGLKSVGFEISKLTGFGQKREMLTAKLISENIATEKQPKQPWHQTFKASKQQSFTVLGAGIAGLSLAEKLQQQGKNVTLIDRQKQPCLETSGNPQAMIMPSFDLNDSQEARFYLTSFLYATRHYSKPFFHQTGVKQLAFDQKQKEWKSKMLSNFNLPRELIQSCDDGLYYPLSGWLDTQGHAQQIFTQIKDYQQADVTQVKQINNQWYLYADETLVLKTDVLILANGINCKNLLEDYDLPIVPKHGQIGIFETEHADNEISEHKSIQLSKGYIIPSWMGKQTLGATFDHLQPQDWYQPAKTTDDYWHKNVEFWKGTTFEKHLNKIENHYPRAGIRVTTPDHLPLCGALIDQKHFKQHYHDICHGKTWKHYPTPRAIENLYLFTGLGSRGFTSAPILAEFLCNQILAKPQVLSINMQQNIHPNRFLYKALKKSKQ
jgi:tRNA 5-methylaminomethyl-2-thiouridine biosynthesis bifunctional protein